METMRLDRYTEQLSVAMKRKTEAEAHRLSKLSGQLHTLSPLQVLSRGYAIIQDKNQQTIKKYSTSLHRSADNGYTIRWCIGLYGR